MRYKTKLVFTIFLFPLLILTIAYVAFTTTFSLKEATENRKEDLEIIKEVTLVDASTTISVKNPQVINNKIELYVSFSNLDDFVEYEITVENKSIENINIKNIEVNQLEPTFQEIKHDISFEPSSDIKNNETTKIRIKIYANEINYEKIVILINY